MNINQFTARTRSNSEPNISSFKSLDSKFHRSLSVPYILEERPCFNGRVTASIIFVGQSGEFNELCDNFNYSCKTKLEKDFPHAIHGLSLDLVRDFPNAELNSKMSGIINYEIKEKAKKVNENYKYGHDFVFNYCINNKLLDFCSQELEYLCEIVIPNFNLEKYQNIDVTTITEKTEPTDGDIIETGIRGVKEEIGIDLELDFGKKIMSPNYQRSFRKKFSPNLPYSFDIGVPGRATGCFIIGTEQDDLLECQILTQEDFTEIKYRRLEKLTINACDI
jgi:hypothetical protein